MNPDTIENLTLFNEKAQFLLRSSFSDSMLRNESGFIAEFKIGQKVDSVLVGAEGESVVAAYAVLRMFLQDNDRLSINNIAKIYEKESKLEDFRKKFQGIRSELNEYLDSSISVTFIINEKEKRYTNREALDLLLYGTICHTNRSKYAELKSLMHFPILSDIFLNQANTTAACLIQAVAALSEINKEALFILLRE